MSDTCSDTCTFKLVAEKRYCASYECVDCGTQEVLWRNNPLQDFHKQFYRKVEVKR